MTSRAHRSTICATATHKTSGTEAQKTAAGSYELHQRYPTSLTQQKALNKLKDYTREMSSHTSPASRKRQKAIYKRSASARGVQRYNSYFNRSLPPEIEEDKVRGIVARVSRQNLAIGKYSKYGNWILKSKTKSSNISQS
ncbi:hypothetical protein F511_12825 [Dorcoceras hygrometricum]|uniref:Uncharacterized protein n=1 Tax=Dorcoceras hygrometricum TaxID=472368 RepID=A0A2Z7CXY6_9LAMI|nr:hypothetical protein F511_12825 [Dorcoceras hygrometricum]